MKLVHPGTTHLLCHWTPVETTEGCGQSLKIQIVGGAGALLRLYRGSLPVSFQPETASSPCAPKHSSKTVPREGRLLLVAQVVWNSISRIWRTRETLTVYGTFGRLGKLACRSAGRRDKAAVSGAGSWPWGPPRSLLHITWFFKNYVVVPTSHLIIFYFSRFFMALGPQAPRGSINIC